MFEYKKLFIKLNIMKKRIITFTILAAVLVLYNFSCQRNDPPPTVPELMQDITNDAMGAIGGVQTSIGIGGPPTTLAHVICYSAVGMWTGLSASGAFSFGKPNWENKYGRNMDIEKINQNALALYDRNNLEYAKLGSLHNNMLHKWALINPGVLFGNNSVTKDFMRTYFDAMGDYANPCEGGFHYGIEDNLTTLGTTSNVNITTLEELENEFNILAQQNPNLGVGIMIIKGITINACNMYIAGNYQQLNEYLHIEVNKVNNNYYILDLSNLAVAIAMINIVTHSYYYWQAYEE